MTIHQTALPDTIHQALAAVLGGEPQNVTLVSGGMINCAARAEVNGEDIFVKWNEDALPFLFTAEANGLEQIRSSGTLRVPNVITVSDDPPFLALEYITPQRPLDVERFTRRFAESLARLHRVTAKTFGLNEDNYIGSLPQFNSPCISWPEFYRERRLLPQIALAQQAGVLPVAHERLLMRVVEKLDNLLQDLPSHPSLLHGDLWSGNFVTTSDTPIVFDPAVYYGEREVELAFIELFGGFPHGFIDAYHSIYPLHDGYEYRRPLHQLYPVLVHLNIFGESYGSDIERICRQYVS